MGSKLIFGLTVLAVVFLQYDFLKPVFDIGLTPEDRGFILFYKTLGSQPLTKILEVWSKHGAYTTIPIYYIGFVESLTGFNYLLIQLAGMFLRTLAVLSIFPLAAVVFKNKWLASLSTIIFAFSYTTSGALETGVEPSEYLGLFLMNIFLLAYYYLNTRLLHLGWLIAASALLFAAVTASVMRVYPILFLLPVIEIFLWILNPGKYKFKYLVIKLAVLYLPFLVLIYHSPAMATGHFLLPALLAEVSGGNWHLLLTPVEGLGFMVPVSKYYLKFGVLDLSQFSRYTAFLSGGPLVIYGAAAWLLSWISMKKPLFLALRIFFLNLGLELLMYWIVGYGGYNPLRLYPVLSGLFILSSAVNFFWVWCRQKEKNNLILALWLGPFAGLFYITATYFFASLDLSFGGAQDHYLLMPTFGISLFAASGLMLLHTKLSGSRIGPALGIGLITLILLALYGLNKELVYGYFNSANANGRAAAGQELIQGRIRQKLTGLDYSRPTLVFFDTSEIPNENRPFYSEGLLTPLSYFMLLQDDKTINGCIGVVYGDNEKIKLKKSMTYSATCVDGSGMSVKEIPLKRDNLYAFKIKDKNFIDIKDQVLRELNLR